MQAIVRFLATGAYTGFAPYAPGTFGTLPAVALAPLVATSAGDPAMLEKLGALLASIAEHQRQIGVLRYSVSDGSEAAAEAMLVLVEDVMRCSAAIQARCLYSSPPPPSLRFGFV